LLEVHFRTTGNDGDKLVQRTTDDEIATVLNDLLKVVKVAMPADLFSVDPRVLKARQLLAMLRQVSDHRPPGLIGSSTDSLLVAFADTPLDLLSAQPEARWDITPGIDRFMASGLAPSDRREAVEQIIREWLTANGYLELAPEELS